MPTYSYLTQSQFLTALAARLYDPTELQWTHAEKILYLREGLRFWNALTAMWRGDFLFTTQNGVAFYDITDTVAMPNTLRPLTLFDTDLYTIIQYHLLEPPTGVNPWAGVSSQFSADDLIGAVQRRRDLLLSISGPTVTRRLVPAAPGRIQLSDLTLDIRRVAYIPAVGAASPMFPDDAWALQSFNRAYTTQAAGTPAAWLQNTEPPISFDPDRSPAFGGNYDVLTVDAGPALSATVANRLSIPDDWTPVIKWGALADLFSREGLAADPLRAQYSEERFRMGAALLTDAPALLTARIGNVPLLIDAMRNADMFNSGWQGATAAAPTILLQSGLNLIALAPKPDAGPYSVQLTVVENAPLPVADSDPVQLSRDDFDAVLDYATHIAMFKLGGKEFTDTMPLLERFIRQAALYNAKLQEWGEFSRILLGMSQQEERTAPRTEPVEVKQ